MTPPPGILGVLYLAFLLLHVVSGFLGMYAGFVPLFTRKGGKAHRTWGRVFTWAMGAAAVSSFPLAAIRADGVQAVVGLLSGYLTLFGYRVLRCTEPAAFSRTDAFLSFAVGICFLVATGIGLVQTVASPHPSARVLLVFSSLGVLVAARDLYGFWRRDTSFSRRILDHGIALSLALTTGFSAFLNTQFYRLTRIEWPMDAKMLLPVGVSLLLLLYWLPIWARRLRTQNSVADILREAGAETSERERMRSFGWAEGISFLLLLGIAVPLKRWGGYPDLVRLLGPIHGALFLLYSISAWMAARAEHWSWKRRLAAQLVGVLPCGTFLFEAWEKYRKEKDK
jgi:integral membrane protein